MVVPQGGGVDAAAGETAEGGASTVQGSWGLSEGGVREVPGRAAGPSIDAVAAGEASPEAGNGWGGAG